MKTNFILSKNAKVLLLCLVVLLVVVKASKLNINLSNLTASILNSVSGVKVEDLGVQFQQLGSGGGAMFIDANGDPHWFVVYSGRAQFWDVNLKTGATKYFNTGKSGLGSYAKTLSGNKLFISVGDTCSLWEYDISAGTFRELKQAGSNNGCGNSTGGQSSYTAPDGMVYIGTAHRSTVIEIDPATGNLRDFGIIDPPAGNPTCNGCPSRQIANIVADAKYVYALMRDTGTNSYWLAIVNRTDGSLSASCNKDDKINSGKVASSVDGTQIWYNLYRVDNTGGKCPTVKGNPPKLKSWFYPSNVYSPGGDSYAQAASVFGVDIDDTGIDVDTSTGGIAKLKYRNPAKTGTWVEKTQSILMKDSQIKRIKAKDNNSAYLVSGTYGPNSLFDGNSSTVLGRTPQSTYAITPLGQYVYLSGYTANTYRYTPGSPWTVMSPSTQTMCNVASPSNPCVAFQGMGKYHYYSVAASNGQLYIASTYKRGSRAGGDIGWINPANGKTGSVALSCDSPSGFTLLSDGITLAYASEAEGGAFGCTNTVGKVFLFDTKTNTITKSFTPITGSTEQGAIIGTNDGGILGIAKDFPSNGIYTMYKVDANGTHASWSPVTVAGNIFGGSGQADRALVKAPDGMVYTWDSTGIIKINPNDGSRSTLFKSSAYITALEFVGDDLYMAVGSNASNLKRIKGVGAIPAALSSNRAITSFEFKGISPNVSGVVNTRSNTVTVTVPFGTNVTSLTPSIGITGVSVSPNSGVAQNFTNPVTYTVTAADASTQTYTVTVNVSPSLPVVTTDKPKTATETSKVVTETAKTTTTTTTTTTKVPPPVLSSERYITSFSFNSLSPAVKGAIGEGSTITLTVPSGTNITSLVPTISFVGSSITPNTGVAQNFTNPVTYTVTAANGATRQYVVTVKVATQATTTTTTTTTTTPPPVTPVTPTTQTTVVVPPPVLSSERYITYFGFNSFSPAVKGAIGEGSTITLTVPSGTNVTSIVPTISFKGASISPNTGVAQNFTNPVTYTVTAANGATRQYVVTVTVTP